MKSLANRFSGWITVTGLLFPALVALWCGMGYVIGWLVMGAFLPHAALWALIPAAMCGGGIVLYLAIRYRWSEARDQSDAGRLQRQAYRLVATVGTSGTGLYQLVGGGLAIAVTPNHHDGFFVFRVPAQLVTGDDGMNAARGDAVFLRRSWLGLSCFGFPANFRAEWAGADQGKRRIMHDVPGLAWPMSLNQALALPEATTIDDVGQLRLLVAQLETYLQYS